MHSNVDEAIFYSGFLSSFDAINVGAFIGNEGVTQLEVTVG